MWVCCLFLVCVCVCVSVCVRTEAANSSVRSRFGLETGRALYDFGFMVSGRLFDSPEKGEPIPPKSGG